MYCNHRTWMKYHRLEAVPWLPWLPHSPRNAWGLEAVWEDDGVVLVSQSVDIPQQQGYLAHKKTLPPRTLQ